MGQEEELSTRQKTFRMFLCCVLLAALAIGGLVAITLASRGSNQKDPVPKIELASMGFTVNNITETRLGAKLDLSIRIPSDLPGFYICLQGDLQTSFLYKNVTLATSTPQKYYDLKYNQPQILRVSAVVDIDRLIGKDIMEDIKEKKEVHFGSRFSLTDCREKTTGILSYACDDITLQKKRKQK